jgi:hypothetical protein
MDEVGDRLGHPTMVARRPRSGFVVSTYAPLDPENGARIDD